MTHIFIADLHLSPHKPELSRLFQKFIAKHSSPECTIYILGDLFDVWLGDDYSPQFYQSDLAALQACQKKGCQVFLMRGNRDFLLGQAFADRAGITLLNDPTLISLHGQVTLLTHGDQLCTDDVDYQKFRATIQSKDWASEFLAKPAAERLQIADHLRKESKRLSQEKNQVIMDANQKAIEGLMRQHHVTQLIHGHTHRPNKHNFTLGDTPVTRWVVGDWHADHAQVLIATKEGIFLTTFKSSL